MGLGRKRAAAPSLGYAREFAAAYQLGRELGRGGNGVVHLATHTETGGHGRGKGRPLEVGFLWGGSSLPPAVQANSPPATVKTCRPQLCCQVHPQDSG